MYFLVSICFPIIWGICFPIFGHQTWPGASSGLAPLDQEWRVAADLDHVPSARRLRTKNAGKLWETMDLAWISSMLLRIHSDNDYSKLFSILNSSHFDTSIFLQDWVCMVWMWRNFTCWAFQIAMCTTIQVLALTPVLAAPGVLGKLHSCDVIFGNMTIVIIVITLIIVIVMIMGIHIMLSATIATQTIINKFNIIQQ